MMLAVSVGGWAAAVGGSLLAIAARRSLGRRMGAVARACHELRGPLTAARLGLELEGRHARPSSRRLRAIEAELRRASAALDDLAELRAGPPPLRTLALLDVGELVADSAEAWQGSAAAAGVQLRSRWAGPPAFAWGDRARLAQALGNLLANAIEHGGDPVRVHGALVNGAIRISVSDGGAGLPAPIRELRRRPRGGLGGRGHGLAIACEIAAAHGGRLACAPAPTGACMVLELPAARAAGPLRRARRESGAPGPQGR